jgi:hypothetical protein
MSGRDDWKKAPTSVAQLRAAARAAEVSRTGSDSRLAWAVLAFVVCCALGVALSLFAK